MITAAQGHVPLLYFGVFSSSYVSCLEAVIYWRNMHHTVCHSTWYSTRLLLIWSWMSLPTLFVLLSLFFLYFCFWPESCNILETLSPDSVTLYMVLELFFLWCCRETSMWFVLLLLLTVKSNWILFSMQLVLIYLNFLSLCLTLTIRKAAPDNQTGTCHQSSKLSFYL